MPRSPPGVESSSLRAILLPVCSALGVDLTSSSVNLQLIINVFSKSIVLTPSLLYCNPSNQLPRGGYLIVTHPFLLHFIKLLPLNPALSNVLLTHTPICSTHLPFFSQHVIAPSLWTSYMSSCDVWSPAVLLPLCDYYLSECAASAG